MTTGAGMTAPLWMPRLCSAAVPASPTPDPARPIRSAGLILDEVQYNPGEPLFQTSYADPHVVRDLGCNGKVYYMFDSPTLAVNWESVDPAVFPKDSPGRKWVDAKAARLDAQHAQCVAAGISAFAQADLVVLPKTLVEQRHIQKTFGDVRDKHTQELLRSLMAQVFERFTSLAGLVVRIGETYLQDAPFHTGGIHNSNSAEQTIIPLVQLLREEVCIGRNKRLVFRTWDSFDVDLKTYLKVSDAIEPHPNLVFSVKHCEGDFIRGNPFSKVIGEGRIPQLIEVQCQREYEGKGAYPHYIANGVIEGFEEHRLNPTRSKYHSIGDFARQCPLFAGIWTWSRGGGWQGPYIKNEIWCDLNAWVMAQWAQNPLATEESIFQRYTTEKLKLDAESAALFRQIALLSAQAVLRGHVSTMSDISPWWTRDDGIVRPTLPEDPVKLKRVIDEKDQAVKLFEEIRKIARQIKFTDPATVDYVLVSSEYGLDLYRIFQAFFHLVAIGANGDKEELKNWLASYDKAWADYRMLPAASNQCATLYKEAKALKSRGEGIDHVVADFRHAAEN